MIFCDEEAIAEDIAKLSSHEFQDVILIDVVD